MGEVVRRFFAGDRIWWFGGLLTLEAIFVATTFRSYGFVLPILLIAAGWAIAKSRKPGGGSTGGWWYVPLSIAAAVGAGAIRLPTSFNTINLIFITADIIAHAALAASLVFWVQRPRRGRVSMMPLGLIIVFGCLAVGGVSTSRTSQTTVGLLAAVAMAAASTMILGRSESPRSSAEFRPVQASPPGPGGDRDAEADRVRFLFSTAILSLLMMATTAVAGVTEWVLPKIRKDLQDTIQRSFDTPADNLRFGGLRYSTDGSIGGIRKNILNNPAEVAVRVRGDRNPGYITGNSFDIYGRGGWKMAANVVPQNDERWDEIRDRSIFPITPPASLKPPKQADRSRSTFRLAGRVPTPADQVVSLEIESDPIKGDVVFLPAGTRLLDAAADELIVSVDGTVRRGVDVSVPYRASVVNRKIKQELPPTRRAVLTSLSPRIGPAIAEFAREAVGDASSPIAQAKAIEAYFSQSDYSLERVKAPRREDAIVHFLKTGHPAHCEYFASATTLMMRALGVPARYVTGYDASEENDEEEGEYLARNRSAHAWCEAYDEASQTWFAVESTPGRRYRSVEDNDANRTQLDDSGGLTGRVDGGEVGWFSSATGWLASRRFTEPLSVVFRFTQVPLFCVLVWILWKRYLGGEASLDPDEREARRMISRTDRRMRRRSLVRGPGETLHQFANRIESAAAESAAPRRSEFLTAAAWYRDYATARYQGLKPTNLSVKT